MSKLWVVLFGRTEADGELEVLKDLLNKAILEHEVAAENHRRSLEALRKEVQKVERKTRNYARKKASSNNSTNESTSTRDS